jgi:hypothetical protein
VLTSAAILSFASVQPKTGNFHIYPHPPPLNGLTRDANHTVKLTSQIAQAQSLEILTRVHSISFILGALTGSAARLMAHSQH